MTRFLHGYPQIIQLRDATSHTHVESMSHSTDLMPITAHRNTMLYSDKHIAFFLQSNISSPSFLSIIEVTNFIYNKFLMQMGTQDEANQIISRKLHAVTDLEL